MEKVLCNSCKQQIKYREDLVVTSYIDIINLKKYHNRCYSSLKKTSDGFFLVGEKPINTRNYRVYSVLRSLVVAAILITIFLLTPNLFSGSLDILYFSLIVLIIIASYEIAMSKKYEEYLPSRKRP